MIKDSKETMAANEAVEEKEKKTTKKKESKSAKELAELKELFEAKEREIAELNDKYLRLMAEYDNFKKRTVKEKEAIYTDSVADTIKVLLPVIDNFERAMAAFSEADKETEFFKGVDMIFAQTKDCFEKLGVSPIASLGEEFNPELHDAIMHIDDETIADNTVVEEFQKGYIYKEKVIRHSMVKVAN